MYVSFKKISYINDDSIPERIKGYYKNIDFEEQITEITPEKFAEELSDMDIRWIISVDTEKNPRFSKTKHPKETIQFFVRWDGSGYGAGKAWGFLEEAGHHGWITTYYKIVPCMHEWIVTNLGRCYNRYTCKNCGISHIIDSTD